MGALAFHRGLLYYKVAMLQGVGVGRAIKKGADSGNGFSFGINFGITNVHNTTRTGDDSFQLDGKVFKLNPLEIKYDRRNLMNGFTISSYSSGNNVEEEEKTVGSSAEIVFRTVDHKMTGSNYFFAKYKREYAFGELTGWVSDQDGTVYSFEDIPGVIQISDIKF